MYSLFFYAVHPDTVLYENLIKFLTQIVEQKSFRMFDEMKFF